MKNEILDELLEQNNKDGKKKEFSQEKKNRYRTEFSMHLNQEGITEDVVEYFVRGLKCGTAYGIMNWIKKESYENQYMEFKKLTESAKITETDSANRLRIVLALLAAFTVDRDQNDEIVGDLLHLMVPLSKKKDGTRMSDISKLFKIYFVDNMRSGMVLPNLNKYHFEESYKNELIEMLEEAIKGISPKGDEEIDRMHALRNWIKFFGAPHESNSESGKDNEGALRTEVNEPECDKSGTTPASDNETDVKGPLTRKLSELLKAVQTCENENLRIHEVLSTKEKEISRLKTSSLKYQESNKAYLEENEKLKNELEDAKKSIAELSAEKTELEARIGRQSAVIDVFDQDKDNSKTEILNQIATSLKKIYVDYKVAENMDMTVDLGENMRDALSDVFRKLAKMGVDIEGR